MDFIGIFKHDMMQKSGIKYDLHIFDTEQDNWPQHAEQRVIDKFPEFRQYAEWMLAVIQQVGGVLNHGKLTDRGRAFHDFKDLYTLGTINELSAEELGALWSRLPMRDDTDVLKYSGRIGGEVHGSGVFVYTFFAHELVKKLIREPKDNTRLLHLAQVLADIALQDPEKRITLIEHVYPGSTRDRGESPEKMRYVLPAYAADALVADVKKDPWLIEALSELVTEMADQSFAGKESGVRHLVTANDPTGKARMRSSRSVAHFVKLLVTLELKPTQGRTK